MVEPIKDTGEPGFLGVLGDLGVAALTAFAIYQSTRDDGTPIEVTTRPDVAVQPAALGMGTILLLIGGGVLLIFLLR